MKDITISLVITYLIERYISPYINWYYEAYVQLHPYEDKSAIYNSVLLYKFAIIAFIYILVYGLVKLAEFLINKIF